MMLFKMLLSSLAIGAAFVRCAHASSYSTKRIFFLLVTVRIQHCVENMTDRLHSGDSFTTSEYEPEGEQPSPEQPLGNPPFPGRTRSGGINWAGVLTTELNTSLTLGYNYAFSGGIVDKNIIPGYFDDIRSFTESMELWEATVPEIPYTSENTLAGVLYGTNDILSEYWERDQDAPVGAIVESYIRQLQILYDADPGVRYFFAITEPRKFLFGMVLPHETDFASAATCTDDYGRAGGRSSSDPEQHQLVQQQSDSWHDGIRRSQPRRYSKADRL
jgi:hypothetical protein